uniref:Uncharacterized protein n=1 Tax=Triticum urartu TaxID=4572 RepID=A0A8R7U9I7_TRIUA
MNGDATGSELRRHQQHWTNLQGKQGEVRDEEKPAAKKRAEHTYTCTCKSTTTTADRRPPQQIRRSDRI